MIRTPNPKLRMFAEPNGSGKSTLFRALRAAHSFPFGYCLNPDEIEKELTEHGRLYLGGWGTQLDDRTIARFVRRHGLAKRIASRVPSARGNALVAPPGYHAGYFTSIFSDLLRREWMSKEESFTFETVMSHPDRVELLREALHRQYRTYLYFVCTNSPTINRGRITNRMRRGGHDVDPAKVEARYRRSLSLLPRALALSTRAFLFDNSGRQHRLIAEFEAGKLLRADDDLPQWFVNAVLMTTRTKKRR